MATLKDIRRRIRSVQSTQQITKAMQMVAAAKLRRSQARAMATRPYAKTMTGILENLAGAATERTHVLLEAREVRRRSLVVITSDKGLCGAFNSNVLRHAEQELRGADRSSVDLIPIGRRASDYFGKRGWSGSMRIHELGDQLDLFKAQRLARHLVDSYGRGDTDKVDFVYTRFITTGRREVVVDAMLPIRAEAGEGGIQKDYIFEPSPKEIYGELLPRYILTRVVSIMADSLASEHAARLTSMSAATKNAGEMILALTLIRNKLRQAAITKEISELVGGAEALR